MAAETLASISGALAQTFAPQITRLWNRQAILAKTLRSLPGVGQGGGQNVAWDVEYSGATAASFAEGSDVAAGEFATDPVTKAVLGWGQYRSAFQLSNLEINAAAGNIANATALEDIVGERFLGSVTKLISKINVDCFSGTGGTSSAPTIVGLDSALDSTGTYAGISKSAVTEWAGNVSSNGGTARALTLPILAGAEQLAFVASGMEPNLLVTTPGVHTKYESLFTDIVRIPNGGGGPIPSFQGSTKNLYWRGNPVMRDRNATAGSLYMVNMDEVELVYLPFPGASPDGVSIMNRGLPSSNGEEMESTPLMARCYPLGRTGSGVKFVVEIYIQLKVRRPNAHALVKDLIEA